VNQVLLALSSLPKLIGTEHPATSAASASSLGSGNSMRITIVCSLLLLSFFRIDFAQSSNETVALPKHASLPTPFSRFSAHDVLKQIFESYDPATGRVSNILNSDLKPTLAQIDEAKLWKANGREYLVVLVELAADDYQFLEGGLCGNCAALCHFGGSQERRR
jgi:hypothetical protein